MEHLDVRSPYVVDTRELGRRPGLSHPLTRTVPAPAHLGTEVIGVAEGSDLQLDLLLESVVEGVLVSGTVHGEATGECVRCLDPVQRSVDVRVQELFAYPGKSSAEDEDVLELQGDLLDLEPALRDAVVPSLPFQPVCTVDCPGLCSQCGARLADDPLHGHDDTDPRWAALRQLAASADSTNTTPTDERPAGPENPRS
ncbi:DUF177 domain-containing protein [Streptomyces sp. NP160]|uniref:YceD family protein n=1 Tax=Streptomyces sp. NP160 TaxID=2586637 RepID=UPI00111B02B4|nr:YceD family protein [Streptomyces sp. NP160]TNM68418.1 DUF177 domain-containing protein [Streptomyces sp. NP160]